MKSGKPWSAKKMMLFTVSLGCMAASAVNFTYNGGSTNNVNDWFDEANWTDPVAATNFPTAGDNALFPVNGKSMIISQVVPEHGQLQTGRGANTTNSAAIIANSVTIVAGGVVTNLNQTIAGILNNGRGSIIIDGGALVTRNIQINVAGGTGGVLPDTLSIIQVNSGSVHVDSSFTGTGTGGNLKIGVNVAGTLEISGGTTVVDTDILFTEGYLRIIGDAGTVTVAGNFAWGTAAAKSTEVDFVLGNAGAVSTIYADTYSQNGSQSLVVDGSLTTVGSTVNLTLIDLASDTFSEAEFVALTNGLSLIHMADGALSLNVSSNQLLFTGTPIPKKLVKGWEFNTAGNTEDFLGGSNGHIVGITVTNAINGPESVLTCADIAGNDPQLYYNQSNANPALFIPAGEGAWRTLEMRLRQIDGNPGDVGVASMPYNAGSTVMIPTPGGNLGAIASSNTKVLNFENQADNWIAVTFDLSSVGTNDLKNLRIDPIGGPANTNFNFEVDYVRIYADELNYGVESPATIIGSKAMAGGLLEFEIHAATPALSQLKGRTDLIYGSWAPAPFASTTGGPFVVSNLTYSTASGTNVLIYVQTDQTAEFFGTGPQ